MFVPVCVLFAMVTMANADFVVENKMALLVTCKEIGDPLCTESI